MGASHGGQGGGFNDFRGLGSDFNDLLTNGVWGRGDDGPCWVFSVWVAVLERGEGRVWLAVLFENGPERTVGSLMALLLSSHSSLLLRNRQCSADDAG